MRDYFSKFGTIVDAVVIRDRASDRSRGFGFVVFTTPEAAMAACSPPVHTLDGRSIEAKRAIPQDEMSAAARVTKLFISGFTPSHTDEEVRRYFEQFGPTSECLIVRDRQSGKPKGYGFVSYLDEAVVERVLSTPHHYVCGLPVEVKVSKPNLSAMANARHGGASFNQSYAAMGMPMDPGFQSYPGYYPPDSYHRGSYPPSYPSQYSAPPPAPPASYPEFPGSMSYQPMPNAPHAIGEFGLQQPQYDAGLGQYPPIDPAGSYQMQQPAMSDPSMAVDPNYGYGYPPVSHPDAGAPVDPQVAANPYAQYSQRMPPAGQPASRTYPYQ
jgi:hypothetical protein